MACVLTVRPDADGVETSTQTGSHPLQRSSVEPALCTMLYGLLRPCGQDGGHPVLWSHCVGQYPLVAVSDPLLSAERLACSPPTKANRVQSLARSPDFRRARRCRWSAGFLRFPPPINSGAVPYPRQSPSSALKTSLEAILSVIGAVVAERLACPPPTKANRLQSPAGSLPDFRIWESCLMTLDGGFSRGSPVYPSPLHPHRLSRPRGSSWKGRGTFYMPIPHCRGAAELRWSYYSPPTKVNWVRFREESLFRISARGNRAGRCSWSAGFLGDLPFPHAPYILRALHTQSLHCIHSILVGPCLHSPVPVDVECPKLGPPAEGRRRGQEIRRYRRRQRPGIARGRAERVAVVALLLGPRALINERRWPQQDHN
ncbi:hypothetical protein PR048_030371 [Dryococelus australis]|uniref:Uncharacterized protein n=1 Tax=Dryococelus australis TaxID=614101 RepID=A0ABQ9G8T1_9NEOP|nr:hypothetical protein PR048_030371 [Dryococelus australis]